MKLVFFIGIFFTCTLAAQGLYPKIYASMGDALYDDAKEFALFKDKDVEAYLELSQKTKILGFEADRERAKRTEYIQALRVLKIHNESLHVKILKQAHSSDFDEDIETAFQEYKQKLMQIREDDNASQSQKECLNDVTALYYHFLKMEKFKHNYSCALFDEARSRLSEYNTAIGKNCEDELLQKIDIIHQNYLTMQCP